jgi:hypothetical protein
MFDKEENDKLRGKILSYTSLSMDPFYDLEDSLASWEDEKKEIIGILEKKGSEKERTLFRDYCNSQLEFVSRVSELKHATSKYLRSKKNLLEGFDLTWY